MYAFLRRSFTILVLFTFSAPFFAYAQNDGSVDALDQIDAIVDSDAEEIQENRISAYEDGQKLMRELLMSTNRQQQVHFQFTYAVANILNTIDVVREDVTEAVGKCAENNPEIAKEITLRFDEWKKTIDPVTDEARQNLENMILVQDYAPPEAVRRVLDRFAEAKQQDENQITKIPVTTPEACRYLLSQMDETETTLNVMVRTVLMQYPQMLQKAQTENTEDSAAEAASNVQPAAE